MSFLRYLIKYRPSPAKRLAFIICCQSAICLLSSSFGLGGRKVGLVWLLTFSKVLGPVERCGRCDLGFSMRSFELEGSLFDAIAGSENEEVAGAETGHEEGTGSVGTELSIADVDDAEGHSCGV